MDRVIFYFDPRCPWCYQTSRWVRRLAELGAVEVDWRLFSLEVVNRPDDTDPADLEPTGSPALRTAVLVAQEHGTEALGPFYAALGWRTFEVAPPPSDPMATIRESLAEVGHDPELCDRALADPATWTAVVDSTGTRRGTDRQARCADDCARRRGRPDDLRSRRVRGAARRRGVGVVGAHRVAGPKRQLLGAQAQPPSPAGPRDHPLVAGTAAPPRRRPRRRGVRPVDTCASA